MALFTYDVSTEHVNTPLPSSREQLMQEQQPDLVTYSMQVRHPAAGAPVAPSTLSALSCIRDKTRQENDIIPGSLAD